MASCVSDDGNYDYLSDEQAGEIKFDTVGMDPAMRQSLFVLSSGQHIEYTPKVKYVHPENLDYAWLLFKTNYNAYEAEQIGNALVYPKPDTISHELNLSWDVNLKPGTICWNFSTAKGATLSYHIGVPVDCTNRLLMGCRSPFRSILSMIYSDGHTTS